LRLIFDSYFIKAKIFESVGLGLEKFAFINYESKIKSVNCTLRHVITSYASYLPTTFFAQAIFRG